METSIGAAFGILARRSPDGTAVVCGDRSLSWRELDDATDRIAARWMRAGTAVDDAVVVALPNGLDLVLALVATWKAGATPTPLSPLLPPAERRAVLDLVRPALVVDEPVEVPGGSAPVLPDRWASCWKAPTSSGSTGRPKVVRAAAPARVDADADVAPFVPRHAVQLVAGPLTHAAPFVYAMRGLMTGHTLVLMERFDAGEWLRLVAHHRATWSVLTPTTMGRIRRHPDWPDADLSTLAVLHLGARCPPALKRDWIERLGPERVVEVYAGTESQGIACIDGTDWLTHPGSVGRPVGDSAFRVVRADGTECPAGEVGEVLMRRGRPTYDYVGASPLVRDGWHTLGDSGWLDDDGYLHVGDRLDDVVVTAGAKVDPADVEAVLDDHPGVRSSVVVGVADDDLGQRVHAVVETDLPWPELDAWVAARLLPEQRPRSWGRSGVPLRDDAGKVRRRDHRPPPQPPAR